MGLAARRRTATRTILLDRALEALPIFRLSDSADECAIAFPPAEGGRWRVLPNPGDRLPGTFDQDVYVELWRRFQEAGAPADGTISFTLHAFLRSIGRRVDGRTYEQLRATLARLEHTTLESRRVYYDASVGACVDSSFTLLSAVVIERRRLTDREQLPLFPALAASEPGEAAVVLAAAPRANIASGHTIALSAPVYHALTSPVARRLYRLLEVARAEGNLAWRISLEELAERLPLTQRYPSHLQRVLQPAHEMLIATGLLRTAAIRQQLRSWYVDYVLGARDAGSGKREAGGDGLAG
ncbi:MAG TPA: replication initiator protein A [Gemmatimonadaceae bacterium]|nr:replication initiator protein A [Gemmatimonadaceae bacterium]